MGLSRQLLRTAMTRLLSKLSTLLQPRVELDKFRLAPLPAEIRASAELMQWMADELPTSRILLKDELPAQHRSWPNVLEWRNFVKAIEALIPDEPTTPTEPDPAYTEAIAAFTDARARLLEECRLMTQAAPGAAAPTKAHQSPFLPSDNQRRVYREHVQTFYQEFIVGKGLKHKDLMVLWAAVYQAILDRTGVRDVPFSGPEFDAFIYDYCGIPYNDSDNRRGRYRSVQDIHARCTNYSQPCPQREDFRFYRSEMIRIIGSNMPTREPRGSDVPRKLPKG